MLSVYVILLLIYKVCKSGHLPLLKCFTPSLLMSHPSTINKYQRKVSYWSFIMLILVSIFNPQVPILLLSIIYGHKVLKYNFFNGRLIPIFISIISILFMAILLYTILFIYIFTEIQCLHLPHNFDTVLHNDNKSFQSHIIIS